MSTQLNSPQLGQVVDEYENEIRQWEGGLARNYIMLALRRCGQMRPGYRPSADLLNDGLSEWQALFDSWAAERSMGFSIPQYVYPVTGPGSESDGNGYDVGPSAHDWAGPRPEVIVRANLKFTSQGPYPVYIQLKSVSAEEWASLAIRIIPGINVTNIFYYDPQFPNGVFNVFPPLTGNAIELFTWQALAAPAYLTAPYAAPPGYMDAIVWSLSERLWPLCTKAFMPNKLAFGYICGKALEACNKVRNVNRNIPKLGSDFKNQQTQAGYYDSQVSRTGLPT